MPTIARDSGGTHTPAPAGTHRAICCQVIECGVLPQTDPKFHEVFKVMIGFELCDVEIEAQDEHGVAIKKKQLISKEYTLAIGEKSNLGKDLTSWRGKPFTDEERKGFVLDKLLGIPCMLAVNHKQTSAGKTTAKIMAVMGARKEDRENYPPLSAEKVHYEVSDYHGGAWDMLPEWVQRKIGTSEEHVAMAAKQGGTGAPQGQPGQADLPEDDDVPF